MLTESFQAPDVLPTIGELHLMQREHLVQGHQKLLDKIKAANAERSKYWILGMVETKRKKGKTQVKPFLQAFYEMPEVKKESYLYEVDNIADTTTLLWVMHPSGKLSFPSLGKSISAAG